MAYEELRRMVDESSRIVFFGGAGVSTESGIPDFRSVDGLYHQKYDYPPETILSHTKKKKKPESCWPSLPRISTGCTRPQAATQSSNTTAVCIAITA